MLLAQLIALAFALDLARAGSSNAARMAIIAMTTSSSIRVKPEREGARVRLRLQRAAAAPLKAPGPEKKGTAFIGQYAIKALFAG
jgi:hypothetical protein